MLFKRVRAYWFVALAPALALALPGAAKADPGPPTITGMQAHWKGSQLASQIIVDWTTIDVYNSYTLQVTENGRPKGDETEHTGGGFGGEYTIYSVPTLGVVVRARVRGWRGSTPGPWSDWKGVTIMQP